MSGGARWAPRAPVAGGWPAAVLLVAALLLLLPPVPAAHAHGRSRSYSTWTFDDGGAHAVVSIASAEAARLGALARPPHAPEAFFVAVLRDGLVAYRHARACARSGPVRLLAARSGTLRAEVAFECGGRVDEVSFASIFDVSRGHVHIASLVNGTAHDGEVVLTRTRARAPVSADAGGQGAAAAGAYLLLGIEHILGGIDHLAFLAGLMLAARRLRDVALLVSGFTIGHSLTLGLAALGWVAVDARLVEAAIGYSVALVAAETLVAGRTNVAVVACATVLLGALPGLVGGHGLPPASVAGLALLAGCFLALGSRADLRVTVRGFVALLFGMLHGFGFAGVLSEIGLPAGRTVAALFGFNVGVEIGQLAVVAAACAIVAVLVRAGAAPVGGARVREFAAAGLTAVGVYWFVGRGYL